MRELGGFFSLLLICFWTTAGVHAHDSNDKNLVQNGSFEKLEADKLVGWKQTTWSGEPTFEIDQRGGKSNSRCVKISSINGADASWSQRIKVKPNTEYRVSVWVRTEGIAAGGYGAQLNFHELQREGKTEPLRGTQPWTELTSEINSGPRSELLLNLLFGGWGRATGVAWFDDVTVVEVKKNVVAPKMSPEEIATLFETKVLPVFEKNCFECHGLGDKVRGGLVMTNREDLIAGGESGEAVDLENPLDSLLLSAINYDSYEMPPDGQLTDDEIQAITTWVQLGAIWKGEGIKHAKAEEHSAPQVNEETKKWWSYQKPVRPAVPEVASHWPATPVDHFVMAKLDASSLEPSKPASREALIRRAYYDLTGLPPTLAQVNQFVNDPDPRSFEKLVDQLLDSPHYGEKWARHWLDVVRYAESNSYERDGTKPFVWRYRDYVIRSFNDNKPYDQFVFEQLAGDEIPGHTADQLIATGFYRLGRWDDEPVDRKQAWYDDIDDVLSTTGQAFLGMTINCSRCHDHKIDPIPQEDYYKMLAFFRNVQRYGVRGHDTVLRQSTRPIAPKDVQDRHSSDVAAYQKAVADNEKSRKEIEERVKLDFIPVEHEEFKHEMNRVPLVQKRVGKQVGEAVFERAEFERYRDLFAEMKRLRAEKPKPLEVALCVTEKGTQAPATYVLVRGNANVEGEEVQPAFPSVLSPPSPDIVVPDDGQSTGRRTALARWVIHEENPLTARVMVNRIWQHHFGRGIVNTPNDFGFQGAQPTHPELLDWLAVEFVASGWDIKAMHRLIMNSRVYQQASSTRPEAVKKDPLNDSFWRFNMRRLSAEEIRDSILFVNGTLNLDKMYGPSIYPTIPAEVLQGQSRPGENWHTSSLQDQARRSVYIHIKRSLPVPIMASFDVADPDTSCPVRFNTVQPTQALAMLNSSFLNEEATKFATDISEQSGDDIETQVRMVLERVFQRKPSSDELSRGVQFINSQVAQGIGSDKALQLFCVIALNLNEFLFLD